MQPSPTPPAEVIGPGAVVAGRYRLEAMLGEGGMATVWRALDLAQGKAFALKILRKDLSSLPEAQERFRRESDLLIRLSHPAIVALDTYGALTDGTLFLAMELLDGETLGQRLRRDGALDPRQLAPIVAGACAGLAFAHARGVVHRDLKPENVFLPTADGATRVKLLDFGISKVFGGERITQTGEILGTPRYMAPEQLSADHDLDARVDVYAMGVILYEALAGQSPFTALSPSELIVAVLHGKAIPLKSAKPSVPPAIESVVTRAMSRAREGRYASIEQLAQAFLSAVGTLGAGALLKGAATAPLGSVTEDEVKRAVAAAGSSRTVVGHGSTRDAPVRASSDAIKPGTFTALPMSPAAAASAPTLAAAPSFAGAAAAPPAQRGALASSSVVAPAPAVVMAPPRQPSPSVASPQSAPTSAMTATPAHAAPAYGAGGSGASLAGIDAGQIPGERSSRMTVIIVAVLAGAISMAAVLIGLSMLAQRRATAPPRPPSTPAAVVPDASLTPIAPHAADVAVPPVSPSPVVPPVAPSPAATNVVEGAPVVAEPVAGGAHEAVEHGEHHVAHHDHDTAAGGTGGHVVDGALNVVVPTGGGDGTTTGHDGTTAGGGNATPATAADLVAAARQASRSGDNAACIALTDQALGLGAGTAAVRLQGDCYRAAGDTAHALADYQRFCRVAPDNPAIGEVTQAAADLGGTCP